MPESPYPDLALDITGEIADAVLRMLRADTDLETVFGNRIYETELERLATDRAGTYQGHTLLVALGPVAEIRAGNGGYTELLTGVDLFYLSPMTQTEGTQRWLRARVFHAIKLCLMAEEGTLRDGSNARITEALKRFERLDFNGRLRADSNIIVTAFRVTFVSYIDEATRTFIS